MGLDMYLFKKTYIGNQYKKPEERVQVLGAKGITTERVYEITEKVAYWRKANQIHNWFVRNCQDGQDDCRRHLVSREQLEMLLKECREVAESSKLVDGDIKNGEKFENGEWKDVVVHGQIIEDPSTAQRLLPTQSGFFFGGTEYDQYYLDDINHTIRQLEDVLAEVDSDDFEYDSSW